MKIPIKKKQINKIMNRSKQFTCFSISETVFIMSFFSVFVDVDVYSIHFYVSNIISLSQVCLKNRTEQNRIEQKTSHLCRLCIFVLTSIE